jgi:hypothetical protein
MARLRRGSVSAQILCLKPKAPQPAVSFATSALAHTLSGREGEFILKYFLVAGPGERKYAARQVVAGQVNVAGSSR